MKPSISLLRHVKLASNLKEPPMPVVSKATAWISCGRFPMGALQLVVTSPPYQHWQRVRNAVLDLDHYVAQQAAVITQCVRATLEKGSICWQVGNYVDNGAIIPLDTILYPVFRSLGLKMRNRIIWHFEHGLHCSNRLSGRYETIVWFTKSDDYTFHLEPDFAFRRNIRARDTLRAPKLSIFWKSTWQESRRCLGNFQTSRATT